MDYEKLYSLNLVREWDAISTIIQALDLGQVFVAESFITP